MYKVKAYTSESESDLYAALLSVRVVEDEGDGTVSSDVHTKALTAAEALHLGTQLVEMAELWLGIYRHTQEGAVLQDDEFKREVYKWLQENDWGTDNPHKRIWLNSMLVNFSYKRDDKVMVTEESRLGELVAALPEGHVVLDYFELITEE
jgi:hypothetical protein